MYAKLLNNGAARVSALGLLISLTGLQACSGEELLGVEQEALTTTSFQDGQLPTTSYSGTRDTMLEGNSQSSNNGSDTAISVDGDDQKEVLLSWDVSTIPTSALIDSATITLEVSDKSDETFTLYEAKQAWNESKATWKIYDTSTNWQTAGGLGANDRGTTALGSFSADPTGSYTITLNTAGRALVQSWVASPASNHGFFLVGPATTNRLEIRSSEYSTKSKRPKLGIGWHDGGGASGGSGSGSAGEITLDPTPGSYKQTCDGSFGVMIDATHFLDGNDENQGMRLYTRGANANALQTLDISSAIGLSTSDEADLEDAARIGNRIYVVSSHGRDKNGNLERQRYRFFAMDVGGASPSITLSVPGYSTQLLDQMLVAANWVTPNTSVISTLNTAANLSKATDANLAPKVNGTNVEGLTWAPTAARPNQLLLGFRNPGLSSGAIIVSLLNADAVLGGATANFGEATLLNLDGAGIRAMTWSAIQNSVLLIAGPRDASSGPFKLYKWSGLPSDAAVYVQDITGIPSDSGPEGIVVYPNTHDIQILFDQGDHLISGTICKDKSTSSQLFSDAIVTPRSNEPQF